MSQNDSLHDQEDERPGFSSTPSFDDQDASQTSSFSMYNSVSQKLMVMPPWTMNLFFFHQQSTMFNH